jgi:uncharacterized protein YndB with AHSA1/START domain
VTTKSIVPAPIRKEIVVQASQAKAFELFTSRMTQWWFPGNGIGASPFKDIVLQPRKCGRWFERAEDGTETNWGDVLEWEPPVRILLAWRIDGTWKFDPRLDTTLEISFEDAGMGMTRVRLEHRDLDRFGEAGLKTVEAMDGGWGKLLERFGSLVERDAARP